MNHVNFSKSSWHFRLANFYGNLWDSETNPDICRYIRAMSFGLLMIFMSLLAATFILLMPLAQLMAWTLAGSLYGFVQIDNLMYSYAALYIVISLLATIVFGCSALSSWNDKRKAEKEKLRWLFGDQTLYPDSFFTVAYRKFKEKVCFKVNLG